MITFLYSKDTTQLNDQIKIISQDNEVKSYDGSETTFEVIYSNISTVDLFGNITYAKVNNLKQVENKVKLDNLFLDQLTQVANSNYIHLFILLNKSINNTNVHIKSLNQNFKYIEFNNDKESVISNLKDFTLKEDITISSATLDFIYELHEGESNLIKNELLKLSLLSNSEITEDTILEYGLQNKKTNVWKLSEHILMGNKSEASRLIDSLLVEGSTIFSIAGLYTKQINFYYQVKILSETFDYKDIATTLRANEFRVKKTLQLVNKISLIKLQVQYINLSDLDYNIKSGKMDPEIAMAIFINN